MRTRFGIMFGIALAFAVAGCEQEGPAEEAGKGFDEAMEEAGDKVEEAVDETGEAIEETGEAIEDKADEMSNE